MIERLNVDKNHVLNEKTHKRMDFFATKQAPDPLINEVLSP